MIGSLRKVGISALTALSLVGCGKAVPTSEQTLHKLIQTVQVAEKNYAQKACKVLSEADFVAARDSFATAQKFSADTACFSANIKAKQEQTKILNELINQINEMSRSVK